jgi:hypothetical protein
VTSDLLAADAPLAFIRITPSAVSGPKGAPGSMNASGHRETAARLRTASATNSHAAGRRPGVGWLLAHRSKKAVSPSWPSRG